jgi:hypothetical protein
MEEIWKKYDERYEVSSFGNVRNEKGLLKQYYSKGYYRCCLNKKIITVHQLVAIVFLNHKPCGMKLVVDHINNIKTDNRVDNLQIITNRENSSKDVKGKSSNYTGVSWSKANSKWRCEIKINNERINLGYFINEIDASNSYQEALDMMNNGKTVLSKKRKLTSNFKGVSWHKATGKWCAQFIRNGEYFYLGLFVNEIEAHESYQNKIKTLKL